MMRFLKEEQDDQSPCSYDGQHSIKAESSFIMVGCTETVCKETAVPSMEALNKKAQFDTAGDQSTSVTETKLERLVWVKTEPSVSLEPSSTELKMIENHQSSLTNIKTEQLGDESQEAQSCNTQGQVKVEQAEIFRKQDLVTYQVRVRFDAEEDKGKAIICKHDNRDDVFAIQKSYLFDQDREPDSDSTLGYAESSTDTDNGGVTECDRGAESSYTSTDTKRRMSDQNDSGHDDSKRKRESEDLTSRSINVKNCLNLKSAEKTNTAASKVVQRRKKKIKTRGKSITSAVEGRFPCPHCDRSYTTTQGLRRHSYSHAAEKPFSCDKCGKRLGSRESLRDHINTHTGDKRFQCRECSSNFATKKYLEKHEFLHTGLRPFKCDTCEQSFSRKGNLQRHRLTHESQKSIMCLLCDKLFYSKGSLDMHTSNIHSEKKSYECSDCGRHFAVKSRLTAHMTKHTLPFQCTVCDNRFSTKVGLQNHVHRVNPCWSDSVCEICGERFRRPKQLQEHKKKFHDY